MRTVCRDPLDGNLPDNGVYLGMMYSLVSRASGAEEGQFTAEWKSALSITIFTDWRATGIEEHWHRPRASLI